MLNAIFLDYIFGHEPFVGSLSLLCVYVCVCVCVREYMNKKIYLES